MRIKILQHIFSSFSVMKRYLTPAIHEMYMDCDIDEDNIVTSRQEKKCALCTIEKHLVRNTSFCFVTVFKTPLIYNIFQHASQMGIK